MLDDQAEIEGYLDRYRLNATGRFVWWRCDGTNTVEMIAAELADAYDTPLSTCRTDVGMFIRELESARLIEANEVHD